MLKRWRLLLVLLALVSVVAAWSVLRAPSVEVVPVSEGPLTQSLVASGRVSTTARVAVASQSTVRIARVLVREGDRVDAGAPLVELETDEADAALASAEAALAEALARTRQVDEVQSPVAEQQLRQAVTARELAEREAQRTRELFGRGFVAQARLDAAVQAAEAARASEQAAVAQARASRADGVERALARARLAQARATLETARARRSLLTLRAPAPAVVLTRQAEAGDMAQSGRTLLELATVGDTRIVASVDEKHLRHLRPGLVAQIVPDAFPERSFPAEIRYVAPSVDPQRGTVEVRLVVPEPPDWLRQDMTVSVDMRLAHRERVRSLPAELVRDLDGASPWVLVVRDGRAVRVPVVVGLRGAGRVELTEGPAAGEPIVPVAAAIGPGDRVRARGPAWPAQTQDVRSSRTAVATTPVDRRRSSAVDA